MRGTKTVQQIRTVQFEKLYEAWKAKRMTQREAAELLDMNERMFRRYVVRYEAGGGEGIKDRRIGRVSPRRASVEETRALEALYRDCYEGRNARHFYEAYREDHGGVRSYSWVKSCLHSSGLVKPLCYYEPHRKRRERKAKVGEMLHQDASLHFWVSREQWDLVITMDDATGEIYSAFFVDEEGRWSSMRGWTRRT